jgi:alkylated DNA repair dioxygenase AlkB
MTVPGLRYIPDYLEEDEQTRLLAEIDRQPWLTNLKRRVQHYGYNYDYSRRSVDGSLYLGALPAWSVRLVERLTRDGWAAEPINQLIVNEYDPGQGIAAHIDHVPSFGNTILSASLGSPCLMTYTNIQTKAEVSLLLEPGSLIVMQDEARYEWKHGIAARKSDVHQGRRIIRGRRVSLTFRSVNKNKE